MTWIHAPGQCPDIFTIQNLYVEDFFFKKKSFHDLDPRARGTANRPVEAVLYAIVQAPCVEVLCQ